MCFAFQFGAPPLSYVLIASVHPLRIYVFRDGLVRLCSVPYEAPSTHNLGNARMHLSNYAINKKKEESPEAQRSRSVFQR